MKKLLLFLLFIGGQIVLYGQKDTSIINTDWYTKNPHSYLKVSLTDYFALEPTYGLSYSTPLRGNPQNHIQIELGYVTFNRSYYILNGDDFDDLSYHGVKGKVQFRQYYLSRSKANAVKRGFSPFMRSYLGIEFSYKYGNIWQQTTVWRDNFGVIQDFITHKHVASVMAVIGSESELMANENYILDWYMGIGIRYKSLNCELDGLSKSEESPFFYDEFQIPMMLNLTFGLKVGFKTN